MMSSTPVHVRALACFTPVLFAATAAAPDADRLSTDYTRRVVFTTERAETFEFETTSFQMLVDGEEIQGRGGMGGGGSTRETRIVQRDRILEDDGAAPVRVQRTYEAVEGEAEEMRRGEPQDRTLESSFDGAVLELALDDGGVVIDVVEGDAEPESPDLFGLALSVDLLLPAEEVEEGSAWDVDGDVLLKAMGLDLDSELFTAPEREADGERRGRGPGGGGLGRGRGAATPWSTFNELDWTVELTLQSVDEDGVATIVIEAEGSGEPSAPEDGGGRFGASEVSGSIEAVLEGALEFSIESEHPVSLRVEGDFSIERNSVREAGDRTVETEIVQEGEFACRMLFEMEELEED